MHIRYDDSLGALIREIFRSRVAGTRPRDDLWEQIQGRLEEKASTAPDRRLKGISIDPGMRLPRVLRPGRAQSADL